MECDKMYRLQVTVDKKLKRLIEHAAIDADMTIKDLVTAILTEHFKVKRP